MLQRRVSVASDDRDVEQGLTTPHEPAPPPRAMEAWVENSQESWANGDTIQKPDTQTGQYDVYKTSDQQWNLENSRNLENNSRPQTWFGYSSPSGNTFVPSRHSVGDATFPARGLSRDEDPSRVWTVRSDSQCEDGAAWKLYCQGCAVLAVLTAFISRLFARIRGSDPSLASGHQSCSVSKRTLHSTEPPKTFSHPDSLNQNQDTLNQNLPNQDPQKYSYLGLSVSVGGYPKYRSYKSQERALNESSDKPKSKTSSTDSSDKHEDVINANNIGGVKFASTVEQETDTSDHTVTQKSDGAEPKTEYQNGHANLNNSAGVDDDVFVSDMQSSHVKQNVTHMEGSSGKRVSVNGTPVVHGGAAGEGGAIQVVPTVDVTTRTRELRRGSVAKGGPFYLARVAEETARLRHFVSISEADLAEAGKTEEVYGKLRAAVGKANLLVTQKFKQFIGLCDDNLHPKEGTVLVTNEDLAGFWDMMTLQVEDVDAGFTEIQQMRDNDWAELSQSSPPPLYRSLSSTSQKESTPEKPKRTPKKSTSASNAKPGKSRADKSRDEARKRLMEAKRLARRKRLTSGSSVDDVEIYVSEPDNKHTS